MSAQSINLQIALAAADSGDAGHWPTVAGILADEVRNLQARQGAAPDLLAACQAFVDMFCDSDMRPEDECHEIYGVCRAAISKAKGEAP